MIGFLISVDMGSGFLEQEIEICCRHRNYGFQNQTCESANLQSEVKT